MSRSADGWTAGTPTAVVMDGRDALIAIGMNGEPLPVSHGFPARLVVPGLYGFVSATKWLAELELSTFDAFDPYWARRGWAKQAPIKTMARIDTPRGLASCRPAGWPSPAWPGRIHRGIERRRGAHRRRCLAAGPAGRRARERHLAPVGPGVGRHHPAATPSPCGPPTATGEVQTADRAGPIPDGASGWHSIVVLVT